MAVGLFYHHSYRRMAGFIARARGYLPQAARMAFPGMVTSTTKAKGNQKESKGTIGDQSESKGIKIATSSLARYFFLCHVQFIKSFLLPAYPRALLPN